MEEWAVMMIGSQFLNAFLKGSTELRMKATISDEAGLTLKSGDGVLCWEAAEGRGGGRHRGRDGSGA